MAAGWFDRHRGIAQGVVATGSGIGTLILVPVVGRIIDQQGWRQAFVILAILAAVTFFLGGIFVKRPPIEPPPAGSDHLREVLATPAFRRLGICAVLQQGSMLAAFAFIVPFATDRGVSSGTAALLVGLVGGSSIVGRLFLTGFANRLGPVRMLQLSFLVQPLAFVIWWLADGRVGGLVVFVLVLGVAYGGFVALLPLVTAHLFGVRGLGSVMGWVFLTGAVGSLILPAAVGFVADAVATQTVPILIVAAISATGAATMLGLERDPIELRLTSAAT
jgi:predicted MFS family arabinose efflux permease